LFNCFHFLKLLTAEDLAQYNGKNGNKTYIAYKGHVYDVSAALHFNDLLNKFEVVGKLP